MRRGDMQLGKPMVDYSDTKANIEALTGLIGGEQAYASDTGEQGHYDFQNSQWVWGVDGLVNPVDLITFNTSYVKTGLEANGSLYWNPDRETLDLKCTDGTTNQIGEELWFYAKNQTGSTIPEGAVVQFDGALGASGIIKIKRAVADGSVPAYTIMGITTNDIANGDNGKVTFFGEINKINTSAWSAGDILYPDPAVAGGLTNVAPEAPNLKYAIAVVLNSHAVNGVILVRAIYTLGIHELDDVTIDTPIAGHMLVYDGTVWRNVPTISSDAVEMPIVGTPSLNTLTEHFTTAHSSGVSDGTITYVEADAGAGTHHIKVAAGEGYIRVSNDQQAALKFIEWSAVTAIEIPTPAAGFETTRFVGIIYNAGVPQVDVRSSFNFNGHDEFWIARVSYDGTTLRILNTYAHAEDIPNQTRRFMRSVFPFIREDSLEGTGGLEIAEVATRQLSMTGGAMWHGYNRYLMSTIAAGTGFYTYYRRAGGGFNSSSGVTQYPNTQYDDGSGTLATMNNNKYACLWIYIDVADNGLDVIYGRGEYNTVADAQDEAIPTTPDHLNYHGKLLARLIFQKSASSANLIESVWSSSFQGGASSNHNDLSGLQGGTAGEYYHLTSAQSAALLGGSGTQYYLPVFTGANSLGALASLGTANSVLLSAGAGANPAWSSFLLTGGQAGQTYTIPNAAAGTFALLNLNQTFTRQQFIDGSADETVLRLQAHSTMGASSYLQTWENSSATILSYISKFGEMYLNTEYASGAAYSNVATLTLAGDGNWANNAAAIRAIVLFNVASTRICQGINALARTGTSISSNWASSFTPGISGGKFLVYGDHNTYSGSSAAGGLFQVQSASNRSGWFLNYYAGYFEIIAEANTARTATTATGVYIKSPTITNITIPNLYGIYIEGQSGGTNSYAIYTNAGLIRFGDDVILADAKNIQLQTTTGTKIGTATSQKLGFWNTTPIVQPTTGIAVATFVANTSGIVNDTATFDGYTVGQVVKALRNVGLLA